MRFLLIVCFLHALSGHAQQPDRKSWKPDDPASHARLGEEAIFVSPSSAADDAYLRNHGLSLVEVGRDIYGISALTSSLSYLDPAPTRQRAQTWTSDPSAWRTYEVRPVKEVLWAMEGEATVRSSVQQGSFKDLDDDEKPLRIRREVSVVRETATILRITIRREQKASKWALRPPKSAVVLHKAVPWQESVGAQIGRMEGANEYDISRLVDIVLSEAGLTVQELEEPNNTNKVLRTFSRIDVLNTMNSFTSVRSRMSDHSPRLVLVRLSAAEKRILGGVIQTRFLPRADRVTFVGEGHYPYVEKMMRKFESIEVLSRALAVRSKSFNAAYIAGFQIRKGDCVKDRLVHDNNKAFKSPKFSIESPQTADQAFIPDRSQHIRGAQTSKTSAGASRNSNAQKSPFSSAQGKAMHSGRKLRNTQTGQMSDDSQDRMYSLALDEVMREDNPDWQKPLPATSLFPSVAKQSVQREAEKKDKEVKTDGKFGSRPPPSEREVPSQRVFVPGQEPDSDAMYIALIIKHRRLGRAERNKLTDDDGNKPQLATQQTAGNIWNTIKLHAGNRWRHSKDPLKDTADFSDLDIRHEPEQGDLGAGRSELNTGEFGSFHNTGTQPSDWGFKESSIRFEDVAGLKKPKNKV